MEVLLTPFFDVPISNKEGGNWARAVISVPMMQTNMRDHLFNRIHSLRSFSDFDLNPHTSFLGCRGLNMK